MKISEIRALPADELRSKLDDARQELMNLRFQMAMGSLTDYTRLRQSRQTVARMLTVMKEREQKTEEGGKA
jgi:large subunit ribosomal protein L29